MDMNKLTALRGVVGAALSLLCMQMAHADRTAKFPADLWLSSISEGYATVAYIVSPDGRIEDAVVLEASHPAFGQGALEAMPKRLPWNRNATLPRYESERFVFRRRGSLDSYFSAAESVRQAKRDQLASKPTTTIVASELPDPLVETGGQGSVCPERQKILSGAATLRYVVDSQGRVRVPHIDNATSDEFALAMLSAAKKWRFVPPRIEGEAVQVEDAQSFMVNATDACVVFKPQAQERVAGR